MDRNYNCDDERCCAEVENPTDEDFISKISAMMYSFGDAKEPLRESVITVATILRRDMDNLLKEAERVAEDIRNSDEIAHEDILFILRGNKGKIKHLMEYLQVLDRRHSNNDSNEKMESWEKCMEFLKYIENDDEYTDALKDETIIEETRFNVLLKRNWLAKFLDKDEFLQYTEAVLESSFNSNERIPAFKKYLFCNEVIELPVTNLACTIIRFLARETIAKIVDLALQVQKRKARLQDNDAHKYAQIVFEAITESVYPSNISPNNKRKSDDHLSENRPGCSQSMLGEHRQDSVGDRANSEVVVEDVVPFKSPSTQEEDTSLDMEELFDFSSLNLNASNSPVADEVQSGDKMYQHYSLKMLLNSSSEDSSSKRKREVRSNISDEKDIFSLEINPIFEERFNKRTVITVDDIAQAYMEFSQYPVTNVLWDRKEKPKPKLLCID